MAIDLFCGVGGLTHGLQSAGVLVAAGVDVDPACEFPFEANNDASFLNRDIRELTVDSLEALWPDDCVRMLAGCAPCQPFSSHRRGVDTSSEEDWALLREFARLVLETRPELVTMENVPRAGSSDVFSDFVATLENDGYRVSWRSLKGVDYGLPQSRRRLVLMASRLGEIAVPEATRLGEAMTVRDAIGHLRPLVGGEADPIDPLHVSRKLSELNLRRIQASKPGGTWEDWPEELRAPCHRRPSGQTFRNPYGRMRWDAPSPTITTLAHNYGTGRFGHPDQDRPISLREAASLQGFPDNYLFVRPTERVYFSTIGRLIGNAVPPPLGQAIGAAVRAHVEMAH